MKETPNDELPNWRPLGVGAAVAFCALFGLTMALALFVPKASAGIAAPTSIDGFEAYLQLRGCVVASIHNTQVTRYRCDVPQPGAYILRKELLDDYHRAASVRDTH